MRCIVTEGPPLLVGRVPYPPGSVVDVVGKAQREVFGERVLRIEDAELLSALDTPAHPFVVEKPLRRARVDYRPRAAAAGSEWLVWLMTRAEARLWGEAVRPATGLEVLAWVRQRQGGAPKASETPETPAPPVKPAAGAKRPRAKRGERKVA